MNYKVISCQNNKAIVEMSTNDLKCLDQLLSVLQSRTSLKVDDIKSRRKIIPYFLNKFHHYVNDNGIEIARRYLDQVKDQKHSNQKKFELCDIRAIFQDQNLTEIQQLWIQFLGECHQIILEDTRVSKSQDLYLSYIPLLLAEASKNELAYNRFLSEKKTLLEKKTKQKQDLLYNSLAEDNDNISLSQNYSSERVTLDTDDYLQGFQDSPFLEQEYQTQSKYKFYEVDSK